jgi:hypothetical protein
MQTTKDAPFAYPLYVAPRFTSRKEELVTYSVHFQLCVGGL